ncbi:MAG: ABC transporter ATP-binding protein [Turicibacter sp.]|jgi:ATP-binding cassette subfamily B multidrug efflux pump|uniref:ABC transporter n=1 Tax=Turicibacter faecis TaxID=2963365 RepID=A0ABN6ZID0_9FIRM|nr:MULTISPECIES: ABC transporter ATP-binding protein [unclassified Turicibacter]MCI8702069.1 ABC transporter ATP-binding protein [Turicibacter sp.]BEH90693.1 ABC transporter [Turicibacter sp. TC023]MCI9350443.1 ABC transporter ATP-binding protein [Turicibacter sp.]MCU7205031.1 ABC transporter ATP-binding protein/permease [Turicibacter sp. TA25]NCE78542.1 ABC transporter ATP-binding protein [Turicibacter sp. TS3]
MIKLLRYLKGSAILYAILAPLFMLVEVSMDLMLPTMLSNIIDIGITNGDTTYVWMTGAKMIGFAVIGLIGGVGCSIFSTIAAVNLGQNLRDGLFATIQSLSFLELDHFKTSSLITRLTNDITQIQTMVMMGLRILVRAPLLCIGGILMAYRLSSDLSGIFVITIPVILIFVAIVMSRSFPLFKSMQEKIDKVNNVMRENLLGVRVIKAFTIEHKQKDRFNEANDDLMNQSIRAQKLMIILNPVVMLLVNFSIVAVLWYGGFLVQAGVLETGKIMAFINYLTQIMMSLMMVIMISMNFSRAKASADRINEVLMTESSIQDSKSPEVIDQYDIEFKDVSFKYHDHSEEVLTDLSFKIKQGDRVGIIGGTGAGKSSLVQLIPRLYDVSSGEVLIGGRNVKEVSLHELRDKIGVVLQESILFSGTIESNIKFGYHDATDEELDQAARDAQAMEFIQLKESGYQTEVEQRGKNLSGGQKQRVSIARTLIRKPKILILDDSSSALDMATERQLQEAIKEQMTGSTVIMIAQRISAVMDANQIIVLDQGHISGIGTHEELLKTNEIYRSIAISQLGEEAVHHG